MTRRRKLWSRRFSLKPGDATLRNNLSYVYFHMGRLDDARTGLLKTLELDPRRKEAHANLADVYANLGRKAEARQHYEEYLRIAPGSSKADDVRRALALLN